MQTNPRGPRRAASKAKAGPGPADRRVLGALLAKAGPALEPRLAALGLQSAGLAVVVSEGRLTLRLTVDKPWEPGQTVPPDPEAGPEIDGGAGAPPVRAGSPAAGPRGNPGSPVTLDDCAAASELVSALLDELDPGDDGPEYVLEVSSPGLDRPLNGERDFRRFAGCLAKVRLRRDGRVGAHTGRILLDPLRLAVPSGEVPFTCDMVLSARLVPEI
ncbi:MAG: hypothetical protein LBP95_02475 [Deltaproteobacteria bacterium]|jgi:ribosome maturation factor RimP|nr:hypothetical protein [Deltaproteobacteria bacterium]